MQNIRQLINIIQKNTTPITILKQDNDTKIHLTLSYPFDALGLHSTEWDTLRTKVYQYWREETDVLSTYINDAFNTNITYKYINVLYSLLPKDSLPTIVLSILCQTPISINTSSLRDMNNDSDTIGDYLSALQLLSQRDLRSYSATKRYTVDLTIEPYLMNLTNGISEINWNNIIRNPKIKSETIGLKHIWDHYDYPHVHTVNDFITYKYLLLTAIKRTWIAGLELTAGVRNVGTRVNYGYMVESMIPHYTPSQIRELSKLNYGTVILPPYKIARIHQLTLNEIEKIVLDVMKCNRFVPSITTIYITVKQLAQEKLLGNKPIITRYTVTHPIQSANNDISFNSYKTNKLPTGDVFNVSDLCKSIEIKHNIVIPYIQPNYIHTIYSSNGISTIANISTTSNVNVNEYSTYLDILSAQAIGQFRISTIEKYFSPNGIKIDSLKNAEKIIAYMVLNDADGMNLQDIDSVPDAILTKTSRQYAYDFQISIQLLEDLLRYNTFLKNDIRTMDIVIVNSSLTPTTFLKLMHFNEISVNTYSLTGETGSQIDSLFAFSLMNSNMVYISMTESDYLNDEDGYALFTTDFHTGVLYSLEFIDFSETILKKVLDTTMESIKLITGKPTVKASVLPLTLNPYKVGVRIMFSIDDGIPYITTDLTKFASNSIRLFSRVISSSEISVSPISSLVYSHQIIPRVGTYLTVRCQDKQFQNALGYMSTICRYVQAKSYSTQYTYYEIDGIVDQSRIVCVDRLKMFRSNKDIKPTQLLAQDIIFQSTKTLNLSYFELVTQTDRLQLYLYRKDQNLITNNLSDYGSADFLNVMLTDNEYVMYDIDKVNTSDIPGVVQIQGMLEWGEKLPYINGHDVLIYNSLFFNPRVTDTDLSAPVIKMLDGIKSADNIYFNLPYMTDQLYHSFLTLNIVELKEGGRYYLKLGGYPEVPCLNATEISNILNAFPSPQYKIAMLEPTLLDYYFTSRMIQRQTSSNEYFKALILHSALPLFMISKA